MVRRNLGLPHRLISKNFNCVIWVKNNSKLPKSVMAPKTMAAKPAAGPETEIGELLMNPITSPPTIPAKIPESGGAPDANAIPKQSGNATRNTTIPEGIFSFIPPNKVFVFFIV